MSNEACQLARFIVRSDFFIKGIWHALGDVKLHLILCKKPITPSIHPLCETVQSHFAMTLLGHDFDLMINRLKSIGASFVGDIETNTFGILQAFFYDPFNNMLEINSELD